VCDLREERKGDVLIIENEPSVADALKIILEDSGYHVSIALNGRAGIDSARRGEFCLTITDLSLTDMTGFDVINAISRNKPQTRFIVITSLDSPDLVDQARSCGAAAVLVKPFLPSDILQLIGTTLGDPQ
jgi:DNA-binding NtrC family response regulator